MKISHSLFAAAVLAGAAIVAMPASAAPALSMGITSGEISKDNLVQQTQARRVGPGRGVGRVGPRGGGVAVRRGGRGIGPAGAAAIGLGVLGAAAIAAGAAQSQPVYRECWVERRPVSDQWGNFAGYRRVRVCN
jgi:hypothetical protein